MIFFRVLVFVNMWLINNAYVFMIMMNIFMVVQMRMNHRLMQVQV